MKIPPPVVVDPAHPRISESITGLATRSGIFCVEVEGRVTYLSSAPNLQRRVVRTLDKLARFLQGTQPRTVLIRTWATQSKLETSLLLYQLAKYHFPNEYLQRVHLRMPWFVGLLTRDPFPRLISANRIPPGCATVIGPFARRDLALLYEQELQGAFLLRRCTEVLDPHPRHPGCIYGEIKQCLRPCQCAVDEQRYLAEAADVTGAMREDGSKTFRELAEWRDAATSSLDFEGAARIHKQLEKLHGAKEARDHVITSVDHFNGLAVTVADTRRIDADGELPQCLLIFPMFQGRWLDSVTVPIPQARASKTLELIIRPHMQTAMDNKDFDSRNTLEDLALFSRWYYSSWREGVWLRFLTVNDVPYGKLVRAIGGLLKPSKVTQREPSMQGK